MSEASRAERSGDGDELGDEPVRIGLIGCGRHARQVLLPAIQRCEGLRLVAIATAEDAKSPGSGHGSDQATIGDEIHGSEQNRVINAKESCNRCGKRHRASSSA